MHEHGDSFTTAQQNAAAQLLEISAAVRELAAEARAAQDGDGVPGTLLPRAQQLEIERGPRGVLGAAANVCAAEDA